MKASATNLSLNWWQSWTLRRIAWRNRVFASKGFQSWASRFPVIRSVARRKAQRAFDLLAGFTYTQTLLACEESGLLDLLGDGVSDVSRIAEVASLGTEAAERLVRAAAGIGIAQEVAPGLWMLGEEGAALINNEGARAMIGHHRLLYEDLSDPLSLLRHNRETPTRLSEFWRYAASPDASAEGAQSVNPYSELMASSQAMVSEQVLASYDFDGVRRLLDVGGGLGVFANSVHSTHPGILIGIFDLPGVIENLQMAGSESASLFAPALHGGDFFRDALPEGYDTMSLVRILHDHDDGPALALLKSIRTALPADGKLIIAEPMADAPGAEAMGATYFGMYLWAMRSGRPRSSAEITAMLEAAGFASVRRLNTLQPVITSLIVAQA